jgi:pimeloyl-ACP methyl ester carboxylesterase
VEERFEANGLTLAGYLARPSRGVARGLPGLVISHGFPAGPDGAQNAGRSYYDLADRIAADMGWVVLVFNYRGCGDSDGDFSLTGWLDDVRGAIDHLAGTDGVNGVWTAGFGTGAALSICAGADDMRVRGVVAVAPPADFADWADDPRRLLAHAREVGAIRHKTFPEDYEAWAAELGSVSAVDRVVDLAPRPLLIIHGADDDLVPVFDARVIADAHGTATLRLVEGGGHRLRYDPRAVAVLLGWLDRQRHSNVY